MEPSVFVVIVWVCQSFKKFLASRLKKSIEENKEIPSDLKKESDILLKEIEYEDINTSLPQNILDNEYYDNNFNSPKILVTTSRNPSQRLIQFLQEIRIIIPNSVRVNRGNIVLKDSKEGTTWELK